MRAGGVVALLPLETVAEPGLLTFHGSWRAIPNPDPPFPLSFLLPVGVGGLICCHQVPTHFDRDDGGGGGDDDDDDGNGK